jgi:hypothetical protein
MLLTTLRTTVEALRIVLRITSLDVHGLYVVGAAAFVELRAYDVAKVEHFLQTSATKRSYVVSTIQFQI